MAAQFKDSSIAEELGCSYSFGSKRRFGVRSLRGYSKINHFFCAKMFNGKPPLRNRFPKGLCHAPFRAFLAIEPFLS